MSDTAPRRRGRRAPADGPRASFRELLPYLAEHKKLLTVAVALSIIASAFTLAQPLVVNVLVGDVQRGEPFGGFIGIIVALLLGGAAVSAVQHYLLQRIGTGVVRSARRQLVAHLLRLPVREYDRRRTGDLVSRISADSTLLYGVLTRGLVDMVGGALTIVGAVIGMLVLDPVLLGLTLLVLAGSIAAVTLLSGRIRTASTRQQVAVGALTADVERSLGAIRTIRASGATDRETTAIAGSTDRAYRAGLDVARASAFVVPIAGIAMQLSFLVVLGVGGLRVATGAIEVGGLVAFILFLFILVMPLGQAFGAISSLSEALGGLGRIREVLALPLEGADDRAGTTATATDRTETALAFDRVDFAYPAADGAEPTPVLHGVSFTVPHGTRTALVGPSGAGKSTMLALIERFYDPTSGAVLLGGRDLRDLDREAFRAGIGYVEQEAPILAGSVAQNLRLGAPDAGDDALLAVLDAVGLREAIMSHPDGLATEVGEHGVMLSGGERQRLAIARTLLAAPPLLLLDESTSNLDGRNEQLLRHAVDAVAEGRTLVVIAHRLATVVDADQIVVVDGGRVVATGTHTELLDASPLYRELAETQLLTGPR